MEYPEKLFLDLAEALTEDLDGLPAEAREIILLRALEWLARPENKRVPLPIFEAKLKIAPVVSIEMVTAYNPATGNSEDIQILLAQRPAADPNFPSMWHCAGVTLLNRETMKGKFDALECREETGERIEAEDVRLAGWVNMPHEQRGHYASPVFLRVLWYQPENANGLWMPIWDFERIAHTLVPSHRDIIIPMAINLLRGGTPYWAELGPHSGQPIKL